MITHYNAFISYRHTERDIAVASEVQKQLEHFRIPEAIQKSSGIRKIERIFRDKDELPLSSNLGTDIETALAQSDYLIVICSPHTAESSWVKREIELFLETHDQNRVLTVISEGEPEDILPERLTYRLETYTDENGKEQTRKVPLEPLSCDYRMPFSKARKQELPRLAAVILGCSYDELVQRARQYRQKRLLAIAGGAGMLAAAAIAWLVWSNLRISENLRQSQINESQYLSFGSAEALNDQDRILAIQLALEALPKDGSERPVIAPAEAALADAIGTYLPSGRQTIYFAADKYSSEAGVLDFWLDSSQTVMIMLDMDYRLTYFDLIENQVITTVEFPGMMSVRQNSDHDLLAWHNENAAVYSQKNGEVLAEFSLPDRITRAECYDGGCIFHTRAGIYDTDNTGKVLNTYSAPETYPYQMGVSDDGRKILFSIAEDDDSYSVILLNHGAMTVLPQRFLYPLDLLFTESGNIITVDYDISREAMSVGQLDIYSPMYWTVSCWSADGQQQLWSHDFSHTLSSASDFCLSSYSDDSGTHECLISSTGQTQTYINTETGEIIRQSEYPSSVIRILSANNNSFISLLSNGSIAILPLEDEDYSTLPAFTARTADGILYANDSQAGVLIRSTGSHSVIRYDQELDNPNYQTFAELNENMIRVMKVSDDYIAVTAWQFSTDETPILIYDRKDPGHHIRFSYPEGNNTAGLYGITADSQTAWSIAAEYNSAVVRRMNLSDGKTEDFRLFSSLDLNDLAAAVNGDTVWSLAYSKKEQMLYGSSFNLVSGKETITSRALEEEFSPARITVRSGGRECLAETDDHNLYLISLSDLSLTKLNDENLPADEYKPVFADRKIAFRTSDSIRVTDESGKTLLDLPQDMMNVLSFSFINNQLAVLTNRGLLNIYDDQGQVIKTYSVPVPESSFYDYYHDFCWNLYDNTLSLFFNNTLYIIDLSQDSPRITMEQAWEYDHKNQEIIVESQFSDSIGIFHVCSAEELIRQGNEIIGDAEIPDDIRKKYGLDD